MSRLAQFSCPGHRVSAISAGLATALTLALTACGTTAVPDSSILQVSGSYYMDDGAIQGYFFGLHGFYPWIMSLPPGRQLPRPPGSIKLCPALRSWLFRQGAVDVGGSMAVVKLWAPYRKVAVSIDSLNIKILKREPAFEHNIVECVPAGESPENIKNAASEYVEPAYRENFNGPHATLGKPLTYKRLTFDDGDPHSRFTVPRGQQVLLTRSVTADRGSYRWELVLDLTLDGRSKQLTISNEGHPFITDSGFRDGLIKREASYYVWCESDKSPHLMLQHPPFRCPAET
jgi:hypothetical protein